VNGKEGVEKFIEYEPALVIMDGDMPILDGYQAFKQIKETDKDANVVIVTGFSEFEPKNVEAIKQGLIKVISKPLSVDELIALAKKYSEISV
jgi:YesN/AraC family two-component response regulator